MNRRIIRSIQLKELGNIISHTQSGLEIVHDRATAGRRHSLKSEKTTEALLQLQCKDFSPDNFRV